jgi:hypothetical protein
MIVISVSFAVSVTVSVIVPNGRRYIQGASKQCDKNDRSGQQPFQSHDYLHDFLDSFCQSPYL